MSRKDYALCGIYLVRPKGALITVFQSPSWNLLFATTSLWKGTIPHRPIVALGFHYKSCRVLCFVRMGLFPDFPWVPSRYRFARVATNTHTQVGVCESCWCHFDSSLSVRRLCQVWLLTNYVFSRSENTAPVLFLIIFNHWSTRRNHAYGPSVFTRVCV